MCGTGDLWNNLHLAIILEEKGHGVKGLAGWSPEMTSLEILPCSLPT